MSLKKPRFLHVQSKTGRYNGFTVYFWPHDIEPDTVCFTFVRCHKNDQFCKRIAREACFHSEVEYQCKVKEFPFRVAMIDHSARYPQQHEVNRYAWLWKYFL